MEPDFGSSERSVELTNTVMDLVIRLGVMALLLYWTFTLLLPFVTIGIWSAVLAVALYPACERVARLLGGRRVLASVVVTFISFLIVIGPATWLALGVVEGVMTLSENLDLSKSALPPPPESLKQWPLVGQAAYNFWYLAATNLKAALVQLSPYLKPLGTSLMQIVADAGGGTFKFFLALILSGFLFAPAPAIGSAINQLARRIAPERGEDFVRLATVTIRAVTRGVIGISALQAFLAGIGLMLLGVPAASLLTTLVLILGIIQIGPSILIIPIIIWSWTAYDTWTAILFTGYMIPVNLLDNILKPLVMARGLSTPMIVILLGVLGGTLSYGITGMFLGPIILAVIWELASAWIMEQKGEPSHSESDQRDKTL